MKKILITILAVLMILSIAACQNTSEDNNDQASTGTASAAGSPTPDTSSSPAPDGGNETTSVISGSLKGGYFTSYEASFNIVDDTKGTFEFVSVNTISEEELSMMEGIEITGSLSIKEISVYDVTYTKNDQDEYTLEGSATGIKMVIEGQDAAKFKQIMKDMVGDDNDAELMVRMFDGETLTGEDMEECTYELNSKIETTFTADGKNLTMKEFVKRYKEYGSALDMREVYKAENNVIRVIESYENDSLYARADYRDTGVIEKETYFFDGEETSIYYDENGEMVE